jgi:hypothetical protein
MNYLEDLSERIERLTGFYKNFEEAVKLAEVVSFVSGTPAPRTVSRDCKVSILTSSLLKKHSSCSDRVLGWENDKIYGSRIFEMMGLQILEEDHVEDFYILIGLSSGPTKDLYSPRTLYSNIMPVVVGP